MRSITRIAAVSAAATALLLGSAATAMANTDDIDDKRFDVMIVEGQHPTLASKGTYAQKIAARNIDVNDMKVNHGKSFVSIRINMHRLNGNSGIESAVRVNGGLEDDYYFYAAADGDGGLYSGTSPSDGETYCTSDPEETEASKRIKGSSKTGVNGYLQVYIPRACFKNPKHLRLGAASALLDFGDVEAASPEGMKQAQAEPTDTFYADPISSVLFGAVEYTRWLTRN